MNPQLNHIIAQQRVAEFQRVAAIHQAEGRMGPPPRRRRVQTVKRISSAFARFATARA